MINCRFLLTIFDLLKSQSNNFMMPAAYNLLVAANFNSVIAARTASSRCLPSLATAQHEKINANYIIIQRPQREICTNCDKMNGDDGSDGHICPADVNCSLLFAAAAAAAVCQCRKLPTII